MLKRFPVAFGTLSPEHTGITQDISSTGMFIRTTKIHSPGHILRICVNLPNNGATSFVGKIVRTYRQHPYTSLTNNGVGIEFLDTEGSSLDYIFGREK